MDKTELTVPAYAKINLFLEIAGKRQDGYHTLQTVMTSVSLCDTVSVSIRAAHGTPKITVGCPGSTLSCGQNNLAWRAADAFLRATESTWDVDITILKRIPMQAGLGGGSSDAAAVLNAMNKLSGGRLSIEQLLNISLPIGSDVPYCIVGGTKLCRGIGEIMSELPPLPFCHIVIAIKNGAAMSTAAAYRALDTYSFQPKTAEAILCVLREQNVGGIGAALFNRFETVLPPEPEILRVLRQTNADGILLSGSGAAVFGIFRDKERADEAARTLSQSGCFACVSVPV